MNRLDATPNSTRRVDWVALLLFAALAVVVFLQFFTRYVLNDSLAWTEEIARYLLIATAYAGSVIAIRRGGHIFLEITYRYAAPTNTKPLVLFIEGTNIAYHLGLAILALLLALRTDQMMVSVAAPKSLVYGFAALCLCTGALYAIAQFAMRLRQSPEQILDEVNATNTNAERSDLD